MICLCSTTQVGGQTLSKKRNVVLKQGGCILEDVLFSGGYSSTVEANYLRIFFFTQK